MKCKSYSLEFCNLFVISVFVFVLFFLSYVKDSDATTVQRELEQVILGIYSISVEGGDATIPPADGGIVIEGVEVLHDLGYIASACACLMGVIYSLNLSYPQELKASVPSWMLADSQTKMLKNKLYE